MPRQTHSKKQSGVRLLLDKKERALSMAVRQMALCSDDASKAEYVNYTNSVISEYDDKRDKERL